MMHAILPPVTPWNIWSDRVPHVPVTESPSLGVFKRNQYRKVLKHLVGACMPLIAAIDAHCYQPKVLQRVCLR